MGENPRDDSAPFLKKCSNTNTLMAQKTTLWFNKTKEQQYEHWLIWVSKWFKIGSENGTFW